MPHRELTAEERWKKHRMRQILVFVTLPGVLLGTASISGAYSAGWFDPPEPEPTCQPEVVPAPKRSSFTLNVMNATGRDGVAASVATEMGKREFKIGGIQNAPETWFVTDPAVVHYGPKGLDNALLVATQVPGAKLFEDGGRKNTSVDMVIGLGYKDLVPRPPRVDPLPKEIALNVYNTTFRTGLASVVAKGLKARGFKVKEVTNDPLKTLQMGTAVIRYGEEGDLVAKVVQQHLPEATLTKDTRAGKTVDVVIGNAFTGLVPEADVPEPAPRPKEARPTVARPCDP
jgi:hypothetical protein